MLAAVGHDCRWLQHHVNVLFERGGRAAKIVRFGLEDQLRRAFLQERCLFLAGFEAVNHTFLSGFTGVFEKLLLLPVLFDAGCKAFDPVGVVDLHQHRGGRAYGRNGPGEPDLGFFAREPDEPKNDQDDRDNNA
jgi:hypothetical protein